MEFWEQAFQQKGEMWGGEPSISAQIASNIFSFNKVQNILIPGMGYGRNAEVFLESGIRVSGIEISKTAIEIARRRLRNDIEIIHGDVKDMPFDNQKYDGIYCHALLHLLDTAERKKFINSCFDQLSENGVLICTAINRKAQNFGKGEKVGENRFEFHKGAKIFFYDRETVRREFERFGTLKIDEVDEDQPMFLIQCCKGKSIS